jgi:hypothetical protein
LRPYDPFPEIHPPASRCAVFASEYQSCRCFFPILDLQFKDSEMSAALPTISLSNLIDDDPVSVESLYQAGISNGFFYLDCRGSHGTDLLQQVEYMYEVAEQVFDLEISEKMQFDLDVIGPAKIDGLGTPPVVGLL